MIVKWIGLVSEFISGLLAFIVLILKYMYSLDHSSSTNKILVTAGLGHLFRIVCLSIYYRLYDETYLYDSLILLVLNRISTLFLLISFSLHSNKCFLVTSKYTLHKLKTRTIINVLTVVFVFISCILLIIYIVFFSSGATEHTETVAMMVDITFMSLLWLIISVLFLFAGRHLIREIDTNIMTSKDPSITRLTTQIRMSSSLGTLGSLIRCFTMFTYTNISPIKLNKENVELLFFVIPDTLTSVSITLLLGRSAMQASRKASKHDRVPRSKMIELSSSVS